MPYLVGFAPASSLVALGLAGKRLALTCRLDLTDVRDDPTAGGVVEALLRAGATRVILVAYASARQESAAALTSMAEWLTDAGLAVLERISVVEERWFDEECSDRRCCPAEGVPTAEHDQAPSTMSFHALAGGYQRDRADLVAQCHPDRPLLTAALRAEIAAVRARVEPCHDDDVISALEAVLGWGSAEPPTAGQLSLASLACCNGEVRDTLYAFLAPGLVAGLGQRNDVLASRLRTAGARAGDLDVAGLLLDGDARDRVLGRLLTWVRNLPDDVPEVTMAALVVAAVAHWSAGDGARARILVDRAHALTMEPMAMLVTLTACLAHGIRLDEPESPAGKRPGHGRHGLSVA